MTPVDQGPCSGAPVRPPSLHGCAGTAITWMGDWGAILSTLPRVCTLVLEQLLRGPPLFSTTFQQAVNLLHLNTPSLVCPPRAPHPDTGRGPLPTSAPLPTAPSSLQNGAHALPCSRGLCTVYRPPCWLQGPLHFYARAWAPLCVLSVPVSPPCACV